MGWAKTIQNTSMRTRSCVHKYMHNYICARVKTPHIESSIEVATKVQNQDCKCSDGDPELRYPVLCTYTVRMFAEASLKRLLFVGKSIALKQCCISRC